MVTMENQLHAAGERSGRPYRQKSQKLRRRAGLPAKHFFARFASLSEAPSEDLEFLAGSLQKALDLDPASQVPALQALVRQELRTRGEGRPS